MRGLTLVVAASLVLIGCGDDGDSGDNGDNGDSDETPTDAGGSQDDGDAETGSDDENDAENDGDADVGELIDDFDFGDGAARVTVGDVDYEFLLGGSESAGGTTFLGTCRELFGVIVGNGFVAGDPETTIEFEIPPPDWQSYEDGRFDGTAPRIEIELGDEGGWAADLELATNRPEIEGQSQLDEWTLDGAVAVGTATFIEMESFSAPVEGATPVTGSFEIGCAEG